MVVIKTLQKRNNVCKGGLHKMRRSSFHRISCIMDRIINKNIYCVEQNNLKSGTNQTPSILYTVLNCTIEYSY